MCGVTYKVVSVYKHKIHLWSVIQDRKKESSFKIHSTYK